MRWRGRVHALKQGGVQAASVLGIVVMMQSLEEGEQDSTGPQRHEKAAEKVSPARMSPQA